MNNKMGYCYCGCGQKTPVARKNRKDRNWVKGRPIKWFPGHINRKHGLPYEIDKKTKCWVWKRYVMPNGYGTMSFEGRMWLAHRYFYVKKYGSIESGLELDHLCRNRQCVNPDHLEPVTRLINSHRGAKTKVTWEIVAKIRSLRGKSTQKEISKKFKIGRTLVYGILENSVWKINN